MVARCLLFRIADGTKELGKASNAHELDSRSASNPQGLVSFGFSPGRRVAAGDRNVQQAAARRGVPDAPRRVDGRGAVGSRGFRSDAEEGVVPRENVSRGS